VHGTFREPAELAYNELFFRQPQNS
jgi:hypothetical protein